MSAPETVLPEGWRRPSGYANGIVAPAGARLLFVAGQIGWDRSGRLVSATLPEQFDRALGNVLEVVGAAGGAPGDVVRMVVYVTDRQQYLAARSGLREVWKRHFGDHYPAMAVLEVKGLVEPGALVEIEAVAALREG